VMDAAMTRLEQINGGVQTDLFEKWWNGFHLYW
jgi:hypothetical protein